MEPKQIPGDPVQALVMELIRTGLMLSGLMSDLLDSLDDDAFPGEENGEVLIEMLTGTVRPVVEAAGSGPAEEATALIGAVADKTLADLRQALELAKSR